MNIQDLLNNTLDIHPDFQQLKLAQKKIRSFLSEFNVVQFNDKSLRRLVKNSFIVEFADGHRKLRHLFLFNDVIACAKYKPSGRDRFEFDLKWFIPLQEVIVYEDVTVDLKEAHSPNIIQLKSQACTVRDQILLEAKEDKKRSGEKHRKKLADLEAQLVLASPNLVFKIGNKTNSKVMTFFLSSDFERTHWIDSIIGLQVMFFISKRSILFLYYTTAFSFKGDSAFRHFLVYIQCSIYQNDRNFVILSCF